MLNCPYTFSFVSTTLTTFLLGLSSYLPRAVSVVILIPLLYVNFSLIKNVVRACENFLDGHQSAATEVVFILNSCQATTESEGSINHNMSPITVRRVSLRPDDFEDFTLGFVHICLL